MLGFAQTALIYAVSFLFVLTFVVTVHELGHFLAAKSFGVAVERFSIGFGKTLASWRDKSGVEWRIAALPLGGYVRFAGDVNDASVPDQNDLKAMREWIEYEEGKDAVKRYFHFKPLWQRAIVVAAGPIANFLLATVLFAALMMTVGEVVSSARVAQVMPGTAAERAGFQAGDVVLKADRRRIASFQDLQRYVMLRGGMEIDFTVERAGRTIELSATPVRETVTDPIAGEQEIGRLGIASFGDPAEVRRVRHLNPITAVGAGAARTWEVLDTTVFYLGRLVRGEVSADQLGGPIRIAQASGAVAQVASEGAPDFATTILAAFVGLLGLTAILSVSVGFMNLLPVPVLDGGHLLFYAYEAVARRPVAAKIQMAGYRVGLALLLGFMLFATWNDLQRLSVFNFLGGLFS